MTWRSSRRLTRAILLLAVALGAAGCSHDTAGLSLAPGDTDPIVFVDDFGNGVGFQAFAGSKVDAVTIDTAIKHSGSASLKVTVPGPGDPSGGYAGGAFTTVRPRDPSSYNALTFWARASRAATLDIAGLGNDNTGTSRYQAGWAGIPLTTTWTKYTIPVPLVGVLRVERGMFFFAEGPESGAGYTLWFDDIQWENVDTISDPRPTMAPRTVNTFVGSVVQVQGTRTTFDVGGTDQAIDHFPAYFTFESSDPSVARPEAGGIRVLAGGTANITAALGAVPVNGTVTLNAAPVPPTPAPNPTVPAGDVLALYSNAYSQLPVDTWSATWDVADVADVKIGNDDAKAYTNLLYAGIEFTSNTVDASAMTHFHLDAWAASGAILRIKLVDFGADGAFGGGDDREHELAFNGGTTPPFVTNTWSSLEVPLASFTNLTTRAHLAQLIISGDPGTVFIDNVYFHR